MRRFAGAALLFILVTTGLYINKAQQLPNTSSSLLVRPSSTTMAQSISHDSKNIVNQIPKVTSDAEANYQLAKLIRSCRNIPNSPDALTLWLEQSQQNNEPESYIKDVISRFDQCSSLHISNTNYIRLLITAAEQHNDIAVSELWSISDHEYFDIMELNNSEWTQKVSARQKFLNKKYELAKRAALTGAELSLQRLIHAYQDYDPETGQPNIVKALAYANFTLKTTNNNDLYRKVDWIKQQIESKLGFQAIEQAQQLTEQLIAESNVIQKANPA